MHLCLFIFQLEFNPSENNTYQFASLAPEFFNQFDCDGAFRNIESRSADYLAKDIQERLDQIKETLNGNTCSTSPTPPNNMAKNNSAKRHSTSIFDKHHAKKQKTDNDIRQRCDECLIDSK